MKIKKIKTKNVSVVKNIFRREAMRLKKIKVKNTPVVKSVRNV